VLSCLAVTGTLISAPGGYPPEWAAYHECGHAIAFWALGLPFEYITISAPSHVQPLKSGTISTVAERWLYCASGIISDYLYRGLVIEDDQIGILLKGGAERFKLTDPVTGQVDTQPLRAKAVGPGGDLEELARVVTAEDWPVYYCASVWRDCESFVKGCMPAIGAVAGRLLVVNRMTCVEVWAVAGPAMLDKPTPVVPEWTARRNGLPKLAWLASLPGAGDDSGAWLTSSESDAGTPVARIAGAISPSAI
jgi:hypothetical protein